MIRRRSLLLAMPAVILTPGLLMPVTPLHDVYFVGWTPDQGQAGWTEHAHFVSARDNSRALEAAMKHWRGSDWRMARAYNVAVRRIEA